MLDRVSNDTQVAQNPKTNQPWPPSEASIQPQEIVASVARKTELAFQTSLSKFKILFNSTPNGVAQTPTKAPPIRQDVVDGVVKSFEYTPPSSYQARLLYVLQDKELNLSHDELLADVRVLTYNILKQDSAGDLLNQPFLN